ncbi:MAG: MFS transporter [Spirochaetota bacterium]
MADQTKGMKAYYGITFLIGLGFFTMGLMDPLYDTYIPIFLERAGVASKGLIGSIMTLDNIFALCLIPIVSAFSDRTRTSIGRRMPYIIVTLPLTAVFFALIPFAAVNGLALLILAIFCLNIFKQAARGPVVALMPDTIPGDYRSEANGVINTMGGIAAIVGTVGLARLMDISVTLPFIGNTKNKLPFPISGILVIFATLLLFIFIKEKKDARPDTTEEKMPVKESLKMILASKEKSAFYILLSLFLWFLGYQGVLPFLGMYTIKYIGVSEGAAALSAGMVAIAYALFAIPSGIIAHKIGRKKVIRVCLLGLTILVGLIFFHDPVTKNLRLSPGMSFAAFALLLFLFGIFWGSVVTNSFPMLWQMASYGNMGIYTGLYYTFSQAAAITAPPITGTISDITSLRGIFMFAALCMFAAFIVMGFVKKGEPKQAAEESG